MKHQLWAGGSPDWFHISINPETDISPHILSQSSKLSETIHNMLLVFYINIVRKKHFSTSLDCLFPLKLLCLLPLPLTTLRTCYLISDISYLQSSPKKHTIFCFCIFLTSLKSKIILHKNFKNLVFTPQCCFCLHHTK